MRKALKEGRDQFDICDNKVEGYCYSCPGSCPRLLVRLRAGENLGVIIVGVKVTQRERGENNKINVGQVRSTTSLLHGFRDTSFSSSYRIHLYLFSSI